MSHTLRLRARHDDLGARWIESAGWEVPASYGDPRGEWEHVRRSVGLLDLGYQGVLRVVGRDRRTWLHGMVTNDVIGLGEGRGTYAAVLNVQGHMLSDLRIFAVADALLLELPPAARDRIAETLDFYLVMEDAEVEDAGEELGILSLQGPAATEVVGGLGLDAEALRPLGIWTSRREGGPLWVTRVERAGEVGFDLWIPADRLDAIWHDLVERVRARGGGPVGMEALNTLRVEAGIPWWGRELNESIVPFEARLESAVSLTKGCYIGQEIIARITARGQVNNLMVGLAYGDAEPPPPATPLIVEGKTVGRTASAVRSPARGETVGLGFLRRAHAAVGTPVVYSADAQEGRATVVELPFVTPKSSS